MKFRRGFIDLVGVTGWYFLDRAEAIFRAAPLVRRLRLEGYVRSLDRLAVCPYLGRLTGLDYVLAGVTPPGLLQLLASPHLGRLRALTASDRLPALTELDLSRNSVGTAGASVLLASPGLERLTFLGLQEAGISEAVGRRLRERFGNRVHF
jgi:hypothetical protein